MNRNRGRVTGAAGQLQALSRNIRFFNSGRNLSASAAHSL
ncbi:hypothetical protein CLOSYM_01679 [[Clostridium] symbiosum ATCC 14940]|uniref:Uncharacterized protein n=1 Tax=[Clostridium] symbiosum ATCC 14940 TaxID=411472 RepID=A0ABC9TZK8_CLOSY|nr:hypothetical protein CLOSYM_01679 [[Clostridium] symbiosum ATCC 14940]